MGKWGPTDLELEERHIGKRAKELREHFELPAEMAVDFMGGAYETTMDDLRRIERGVRISPREIQNLCGLYGVSEKNLRHGEGFHGAKLDLKAAHNLAAYNLHFQNASVSCSESGKAYLEEKGMSGWIVTFDAYLIAEDGEVSVVVKGYGKEDDPKVTIGTLDLDSFDARFVDKDAFYEKLFAQGETHETAKLRPGEYFHVELDMENYFGRRIPHASDVGKILGFPVQERIENRGLIDGFELKNALEHLESDLEDIEGIQQ